MARKAKQVKRKLALHRKGRPRWGAGFQQRIVPAARGGPSSAQERGRNEPWWVGSGCGCVPDTAGFMPRRRWP